MRLGSRHYLEKICGAGFGSEMTNHRLYLLRRSRCSRHARFVLPPAFYNPGWNRVRTRSYEVSMRLLASGHQVTMVCGTAALSKSGLSGPFLSGRREGSVDGIYVIELELPYSNYDSFLAGSWTFLRFAFRSVFWRLGLDYDVLFRYFYTFDRSFAGDCCAMVTPQTIRLRGTRSVARAAAGNGRYRNPLVLRVMDWLEFVAYHSANSCVALSSGIAQGIARRGVPEIASLLLRTAAVWICLPRCRRAGN